MNSFKKNICRFNIAFTIIVILIGLDYAFTSEKITIAYSPETAFRLEIYMAPPIVRLWHHDMELPAFAQLYQIGDDVLLAESKVVDLWHNSDVQWNLNPPKYEVRLGKDVVFKNVLPECNDCPRPFVKHINP